MRPGAVKYSPFLAATPRKSAESENPKGLSEGIGVSGEDGEIALGLDHLPGDLEAIPNLLLV